MIQLFRRRLLNSVGYAICDSLVVNAVESDDFSPISNCDAGNNTETCIGGKINIGFAPSVEKPIRILVAVVQTLLLESPDCSSEQKCLLLTPDVSKIEFSVLKAHATPASSIAVPCMLI